MSQSSQATATGKLGSAGGDPDSYICSLDLSGREIKVRLNVETSLGCISSIDPPRELLDDEDRAAAEQHDRQNENRWIPFRLRTSRKTAEFKNDKSKWAAVKDSCRETAQQRFLSHIDMIEAGGNGIQEMSTYEVVITEITEHYVKGICSYTCWNGTSYEDCPVKPPYMDGGRTYVVAERVEYQKQRMAVGA
ncbi:MAG: hypothetical protein Q9162_005327 [Coniocarpon cinnabarinum]